jgi:hypothetical protein
MSVAWSVSSPAASGPSDAAPLHRHLEEDEMFYLLSGTARIQCDGEDLTAGPGDFVLLPVGLPHTFVVGPDAPLHILQITTPSGFDEFVADVSEPARQRRLPDPAPMDPAALGHAAARHRIEILGPPRPQPVEPRPPGSWVISGLPSLASR